MWCAARLVCSTFNLSSAAVEARTSAWLLASSISIPARVQSCSMSARVSSFSGSVFAIVAHALRMGSEVHTQLLKYDFRLDCGGKLSIAVLVIGRRPLDLEVSGLGQCKPMQFRTGLTETLHGSTIQASYQVSNRHSAPFS